MSENIGNVQAAFDDGGDWTDSLPVIPSGRARLLDAPSDDVSLWTPLTEWNNNLVLYEWSTIAGHLFNGSGVNYSIGGMYLEFENNAGTVTAPTFDRSRTISYYNNLAGSSVRDYLRVAMTSTQLLTTDSSLWPGGNQCVFFTRSSGTSGVHGRDFSNGDDSKIFGASLVAYVAGDDATQDLLLSSMYFDVSDQQVKLSTSQIGIEWELKLE